MLLHSHTSYTVPVTTCNPAACTDMFNENTPAGSQHHKHNKTCGGKYSCEYASGDRGPSCVGGACWRYQFAHPGVSSKIGCNSFSPSDSHSP